MCDLGSTYEWNEHADLTRVLVVRRAQIGAKHPLLGAGAQVQDRNRHQERARREQDVPGRERRAACISRMDNGPHRNTLRKKLIDYIKSRGAEAVIPPRSNLKEQREYDRHLYKERNLVERFINRIKQFRRVATRYEKTARNFLAFVQVAAITVLLQ